MESEHEQDGCLRCLNRVMRREMHFMAHSPFCTLFILLLPVVSFAIMCAIFYVEVPRDLPIVVHDGDASALSRQLVRMADASSGMQVIAKVRDMEEGADFVRRGEAYAVLYIPAGLERDAKRGEAPPVVGYFNNQWLLTSGLLSRALREVTGTLSAGLDVRTRMLKGENPAMAWEKYEPIRVDAHPMFNPNMNYRFFLLPSLLPTLIQAFVIMMTVRAVGGELKHGTAGAWLAAAGDRPWIALLGKLLPYTAAYLILTNFMLALLVRFMNVPINGSLRMLLAASVLFVLSYQSMGTAFAVFTANLRLANSLAGFYAGPAFAFAGITYPSAGMPAIAKALGACLPLVHYLHIMLQQALRGAPWQASLPYLAALLAFVAVPPLLFLPRLGRVMRDQKYWGRL